MGVSDIKGQDLAVSLLWRALDQGHLNQAYLFIGKEGVGKKFVAFSLAKSLYCRLRERDFCGDCPSCRQIAAGNHPNVIHLTVGTPQIESARTGKGKDHIIIDQVRELEHQLGLMPYETGTRVIVIDPAEKMTIGAANCLLKTLEEPPPNTVFILITAALHLLLPTIVSRCQAVHFAPLSPEHLMDIMAADDRELTPAASRLSEGSVSTAAILADESIIAYFDEVLAAIHPKSSAGWSEIFALAESLGREKEQFPLILTALLGWFRDVMAVSHGLEHDLLIFNERFDELREWSDYLGSLGAQAFFKSILRCQEEIPYNINPQMLLENLFLQAKSGKLLSASF